MNSLSTVSYADRVRGGLLGLLVGDALGVPYEFKSSEDLPDSIDFRLPPGFPRSHAGVPVGTWSDDGAMALCLLDSLLHCGRLDTTDLGERFTRWMTLGYLAVDQHVFDIGMQTSRSLRAIQTGTPAERAGGDDVSSNGNGSLMRVLPLVLWHQGPDEALIADAEAQSRITHAHPRSQAACALYCLWARRILHGVEDAWDDAVSTLDAHYARTNPAFLRELRHELLPDHGARGSGYVVHTVHSARDALQERTFAEVAVRAIRFGEDTDTNAAVACGLAGLRDGVAGIPAEWLAALRGRELVDPMLAALLAR